MRRPMVMVLLAASSVFAVAQTLPMEVQRYVERREACDHWRGEPPFDKSRQREIHRNVCTACRGADAKLAALKKKYRADPAVRAALAEFEDRIELPSPKAMARSCRSTARRPAP